MFTRKTFKEVFNTLLTAYPFVNEVAGWICKELMSSAGGRRAGPASPLLRPRFVSLETNRGRAGYEGGTSRVRGGYQQASRALPRSEGGDGLSGKNVVWRASLPQYLMSICCMNVRYSPGVLPFFLRKMRMKLDWLLKPQL